MRCVNHQNFRSQFGQLLQNFGKCVHPDPSDEAVRRRSSEVKCSFEWRAGDVSANGGTFFPGNVHAKRVNFFLNETGVPLRISPSPFPKSYAMLLRRRSSEVMWRDSFFKNFSLNIAMDFAK
jgi:hypothetical protein